MCNSSQNSVNRASRFLLMLVCGLTVFVAEGASIASQSTPVLPDPVLVVTSRPLTPEQTERLREADSLLIMIPGISSGDLDESCRFLDRVRRQGTAPVAIFYDWEADNPSRIIVSPTAVNPGATRLVALCEAFQNGASIQKPIDVLAHSAGTVVLNKAAMEITATGSSVQFRHVLLLGTALGADEPLLDLKAVSSHILNVHSAYDKINRNINDRLGTLSALDSDVYRNLRMDHSLSGRIVRHHVFLSSDPENGLQYGLYLATGRWPSPTSAPPGEDGPPDALHGLTLWVTQQPDETHKEIRAKLPAWLAHSDPDVAYYAVVLAGLLKEESLGHTLKRQLADEETPVYIRKEIYQAFGNFEDGTYVDFLRSSRKADPACSEEIRDVARALKRKRVEPIRTRRKRRASDP